MWIIKNKTIHYGLQDNWIWSLFICDLRDAPIYKYRQYSFRALVSLVYAARQTRWRVNSVNTTSIKNYVWYNVFFYFILFTLVWEKVLSAKFLSDNIVTYKCSTMLLLLFIVMVTRHRKWKTINIVNIILFGTTLIVHVVPIHCMVFLLHMYFCEE